MCNGGKIRTCVLLVMSQVSYHCSTPHRKYTQLFQIKKPALLRAKLRIVERRYGQSTPNICASKRGVTGLFPFTHKHLYLLLMSIGCFFHVGDFLLQIAIIVVGAIYLSNDIHVAFKCHVHATTGSSCHCQDYAPCKPCNSLIEDCLLFLCHRFSGVYMSSKSMRTLLPNSRL